VVGEVSDGFEAVRKAQELQPDLIMLDIGLPGLNGIEAARQIRRLSPKSKIVFVSQESSADVVLEAFSVGAYGYVVKMEAGGELLAAVDAAVRGEQFVGKIVAGHDLTGTSDMPASDEGEPEDFQSKTGFASRLRENGIARRHEVEFYSDDGSFLDRFTRFIGAALMVGKAVIVVATQSHRDSLLLRLQAQGLDIGAAIEEGRYISLDAPETLSTFMVDGLPDPVRFRKVAGDLIAGAANTVSGKPSRVAACGEGVSLLWTQGNADGAIRLEQLWDEIARSYGIEVLCGYSLDSVQAGMDTHIFQRICAEHSAAHSY
jgi:CheY-like chemotaxis protein